ncbi:predicted protein [Chaetoceros tenuissimus]|uniref:Uncharacterized protein n=1 Tax=Chaetoceros tenuissimus TaxID=426638 RepID=A0AAD3HBE0_9STRA|nr:predicted protein [Chaetoceros tenuissimus]
MVTVEVLSSTLLKNERGFRQSKKRQPDLIESLAKDAAATLIQARSRGIIIRKSFWCDEKISIGCQVEEVRVVEDEECSVESIACQTQSPLLLECSTQTESNQSTKRRREAPLLNIYLECKTQRSVIEVDGKEVVYILKEMGLIGPKEFEGLLKTASVQNRQHLHKSQAITYPLSISSVQDFEIDLVSAWIELNEAAYRTPTVLMPSKKRTQFVLNNNISRAFDSVQSLVECPSEFVTFLIDHPFVLSYSKLKSYEGLCALDIEIGNPIDTREHFTILDYLSKELKQSKTFSWKRERINLAYELIKKVSTWENQSDDDAFEDSFHIQAQRLHEANVKILELQTELQLLKETQAMTSSKNEVSVDIPKKDCIPKQKKESNKAAQVQPSTTSRKVNEAVPPQRPLKQKKGKKKNILNTVNLTLSPLGNKTKPTATTRPNPKLRKSTSGISRNSGESNKSTRSRAKQPPPRSNKVTSSNAASYINNNTSNKESNRTQATANEKFNKIMERLNLY